MPRPQHLSKVKKVQNCLQLASGADKKEKKEKKRNVFVISKYPTNVAATANDSKRHVTIASTKVEHGIFYKYQDYKSFELQSCREVEWKTMQMNWP